MSRFFVWKRVTSQVFCLIGLYVLASTPVCAQQEKVTPEKQPAEATVKKAAEQKDDDPRDRFVLHAQLCPPSGQPRRSSRHGTGFGKKNNDLCGTGVSLAAGVLRDDLRLGFFGQRRHGQ